MKQNNLSINVPSALQYYLVYSDVFHKTKQLKNLIIESC